MTLHDLKNGDVFHHANDKAKNLKKYVVYGNPRFNAGHGGATRDCLDGKEIVSKSCRLVVVKTGVSVYADKIRAKFDIVSVK